MRGLLIAAGGVLLIAAGVLWFGWNGDSVKTVDETSTVSKVSPAAGTTPPTETEGASSGDAEATESTSTTASSKTSKTTTEPSDRLPDAVLGGVLALGGALLLAGAFFDRITSIKAAGLEIGLGAKVAETIAASTTPTTDAEKAKVRAAYYLTLDRLPPGTSPGDDPLIEATALSAMETVGLTSTGDD